MKPSGNQPTIKEIAEKIELIRREMAELNKMLDRLRAAIRRGNLKDVVDDDPEQK